MTTCKACGHKIEDGELCADCARKLGLTSGDAVRRASPCAKCNHPELIRALVRELTSITGGPNVNRTTFPMAVTYGPDVSSALWGKFKSIHGADESAPFGILEMYVCARCGFTEWYCRDPKNIPIGPEFGTQMISVAGEAPYR
jgi:hypothetical protein